MLRSQLSVYALSILLLAACAPLPVSEGIPEPLASPGTLEASLLARNSSDLLFPIDPTSGEALPDYEPIPIGQAYAYAFSPSGHRLALVSGGDLILVDLPAWEHRTLKLNLLYPTYQVVFSPDGEQLVIAGGNRSSQLVLFDLGQEVVTAEGALDFLVYQLRFTENGSGLMVYGSVIENRFTLNEMSPDPPLVALLDRANLKAGWIVALEGVQHGIVPKDENVDLSKELHHTGQAIFLKPGLAFAPDRDVLYVVHASGELLTTVDFSARQVATLEIKDQMSWLERLLSLGAGRARAKVAEGTYLNAVISPDGRSLYVVGQSSSLLDNDGDKWEILDTPYGLHVIDTATGIRRRWHQSAATDLSISADGSNLYLSAWDENLPWTEVFDTATQKVVKRLDALWLTPVRSLDGDSMLASGVTISGDRQVNTLIDLQRLQTVVEWTSDGYLVWISRP
jgi:hypothetical protein